MFRGANSDDEDGFKFNKPGYNKVQTDSDE